MQAVHSNFDLNCLIESMKSSSPGPEAVDSLYLFNLEWSSRIPCLQTERDITVVFLLKPIGRHHENRAESAKAKEKPF